MSRNSVYKPDKITKIVDEYIRAKRSGGSKNIDYYFGRYPKLRKQIAKAIQTEVAGELLFEPFKSEKEPTFSQREIESLAEKTVEQIEMAEKLNEARKSSLIDLINRAKQNDTSAREILHEVYKWLVCESTTSSLFSDVEPISDVEPTPFPVMRVASARIYHLQKEKILDDRCFIPHHIKVRVVTEITHCDIHFQIVRFSIDEKGKLTLHLLIPNQNLTGTDSEGLSVFFEFDSLKIKVGTFSTTTNQLNVELPLIFPGN